MPQLLKDIFPEAQLDHPGLRQMMPGPKKLLKDIFPRRPGGVGLPPGHPGYEFDRKSGTGDLVQEQVDPVDFARSFAEKLGTRSESTAFVAPRKTDPYFEQQERMHRMGHYDESRRPVYNPRTGRLEQPAPEEPLY